MGAKRRRTAGRRDRTVPDWDGPSTASSPAEIVTEAVDALVMGRGGDGVDLAAALLADTEDAARVHDAERALTEALRDAMTSVWARGWQPAETTRRVERLLGPAAAAVCAHAITADLERHAPTTVAPDWIAQARALDTVGDPLAHLADAHGLLRFEAVEQVLRTLAALRVLPPLQRLVDPPGAHRPGRARPTRARTEVDRGKLARVRALLAKAESTEFPEEAEALSARAQELMARHSIDRALLDEDDPDSSEAGHARRLPVDAPYDESKAVLLHEVAEANHCRAVWHRELEMCTVMGFPDDVDAVDLLFTSLLVQAETAMRAGSSARDRSGRRAGKDFRSSFMSAFAVRVGERLTEAARTARDAVQAEAGRDLVPLFAAREREVERAVEQAFGELTYSRVRGPYSEDGWNAGRAAADAASLGSRRPVTGR
ncbi:DUF2786 domain-containing protein [Nocardiopsis sp. N85]|uniref:DUF2786 domain-containing protein n=1 Tax=Nocardiopsis sp. N85 TaxID=3029400 RepID=UPI00237F269C|nr:DUF2786 domain-containing protein [Nocardiopsis sp. N85]MDE3723350.1 DUF2786 domain-containing protein [Nocardiopsis sp. N85]